MSPSQTPLGSGLKSVTTELWAFTAGYTRFVKSVKVLLCLLVLALTCLILFYPIIKKNSDLRIAFTSVEKTVTPPPTQMINANFHGFDDNNQPYNVTAKSALQLDDDNVALDSINGDLTLNSGLWLTVAAHNGSFKIKERLLNLRGAVEMFDDEGYELRTEYVDINIGKKTAVTNQLVNGQGPLGVLKSQGAVYDGTSKVITFTGPVSVTIYLPPKEKQPTAGKSQ